MKISTKSTIKYNNKRFGRDEKTNEELPDYHLYKEVFENDGIYLELEGKFKADNKGVTIKIPYKLWNEIIDAGKLKKITIKDVYDEDEEEEVLILESEMDNYVKTKTGEIVPSGVITEGELSDVKCEKHNCGCRGTKCDEWDVCEKAKKEIIENRKKLNEVEE